MSDVFDFNDPNLQRKLKVAMSDYSNLCNRDRPYIGQPHTFTGVRGTDLVQGITMRDVYDCVGVALGICASGKLHDRYEEGRGFSTEDLYSVPNQAWTKIDPVAIMQAVCLEIEKRELDDE